MPQYQGNIFSFFAINYREQRTLSRMKTSPPISLVPFVFISFFIITCHTIHAQVEKDTLLASQYFATADTLLTYRKLDSAVVYFKKGLPIYTKAKTWERVARCYNKISESQWRNEKYEESLSSAKQALAVSDQYLQENNREKAYGFDNIGDYYRRKKLDLDKALAYYQKALKIKLTIFSKNHLYVADSYQSIGNTLLLQRKYNKALEYYKKAIVIREDKLGPDHIDTGMSYFNLGLTYDRKEEYNKALLYFNHVLAIRIKKLGENHKDVALCNRVIGWLYQKKGTYDKAIPYLEKNLSILIHIYGKKHHTLIDAFNTIGICHKQKGDYNKALTYYNQAIDIENNQSEQNKKNYHFSVYNNVGVIYKYKGQYEKALKYYIKALHTNLKRGSNNKHIALNYNNIGKIYRLKEDYDEALDYYKKALSIRTKTFDENNSDIAYSYHDIGELYTIKKKYNKALFNTKKALEIRQKVFGEYHPEIADSYVSLGNIYKNKKQYKLALENDQKALRIRQKVFGVHHPKVAVSNNDIANVYTLQKDYKNSLLYYKKAINANIKGNQYLDSNVLLTTLSGKAKTYIGLYKESNNSDDLNQAIATYKKEDTLINDIRQTFTTYQDKVAFAQKAKDVYQGAIQTQLLLYAIQKEQSTLERAFYYAEKSKANTLKELLSEANAKNFTGLPNDVLTLEKELRIDKAFYQSKATESFNKVSSDSVERLSRMTTYENKLFDINRKQDSLTQVLEKNYPKYHQLKYQNDIVSVTDIQQQLDDKTTVLEFFTGDSISYAFTISKHDIKVKELSTPKLTEQVEAFRKSIIDQDVRSYKKQANILYQKLIAPIVDELIGDELIIVPDGPLWHLNFDLLLTQKDDSNNPALLSYLLNDYAITYANSANLLFAPFKNSQHSETLQECLAFSFSDSTQTTATNTVRLATLRDAGGDLPGTREEIRAIADIIDGQYYYGSQAVEANFKSNASRYNILHLALHGEVDNERPENSKLYFTKSKDTIEDNLLYSHELFALDIPAELTVLSACNTGAGKIAKGEGIMSLGNAFQYAGTKSLLLTNWEVSDKTTPDVMKYFYINLKAGMNKGKALQQAKLEYLAKADINRTAPFYWGAFYLVGDAAPMHFENNTLVYWAMGLGVLGIIILVGFWYRRRNKV
ncbi:tetratricopeptide repeat protein [Aquimarina sp. AU119]|uniref:CHAT domain-containing protein n=1 Tax=Aquimarina sp. AU119 TaxID=2108528 RepID=UPI001358AD6C|nr:tetratricopeptide repeat protein [Aquimarina sp. AU119]